MYGILLKWKSPFHITLIFIFLVLLDLATSKLTPEDVAMYHDIKRNAMLSSRVGMHLSRRGIPSELHGRSTHLPCGTYHSVTMIGPVHFSFRRMEEECGYAFVGSKAQNCTVSVICRGDITIEPSNGYVIFTDGVGGSMTGTGTFSFFGTPRYPRQGASSIYVKYSGHAENSVCSAFCTEDLTREHYMENKLRKPKKLPKTNHYKDVVRDEGCKCGFKNEQMGRVVGGSEAVPFEFPWLAALVFKFPGTERKPMCGASLISNRYLLSAAHCFELDFMQVTEEDIQVVLHAYNMDYFTRQGDTGNEPQYKRIPGYNLPHKTDSDEASLRLNVRRLVVHPLFEKNSFDFDIAIIELEEPVDITDKKFTPICLPPMGQTVEFSQDKMHTVAGWGFYSEEAPATSRITEKLDVAMGKCKAEWHGSPRHICLGFLEGGKDACQGDSGGPLVYPFKPETHQYMLSGIVSAGNGCARRGIYGFYSNVQDMLQWIYFQMRAEDNKLCSI